MPTSLRCVGIAQLSVRRMFAIVSECCPLSCLTPVFLIRSRKDEHIYSYCWACSSMWSHPLAAIEDGPDAEILDPGSHLPDGFDLPTDAEIAAIGFSKFVLRTIDDPNCARYFNVDLYGHGM